MELLGLCFMTFACLLLGGWFVKWVQRVSNGDLSKLPGPKQHWLLGNLIELVRAPSTHKIYYKWVQEFGPILKVRVLGTTLVLVTDPTFVHRAYRPGHDQLQKFFKYPSLYHAFNFFVKPPHPNILTSPTNDYWRAVRRATAPAFSMQSMRSAFPQVCSVSRRAAQFLLGVAPGVAIDIDNVAQRLAIDVLGHFGFNQELGAIESNNSLELKTVKQTLAAMQKRIHPLNQWFPWRKEAREFWDQVEICDSLCTHFVKAMLATPPPKHTLAAHILNAVDPETGKQLSFEKLKAEVSIFLVAGFETTAHSISWTLFQLAVNPEADRRVAAELSSLGLLSEAGGAEPRDPCWDDLSKIPYLNAVINESMRMMPVVAQGSPRVLNKDTELLGYKLPAGTPIFMPFYAIHNSPLYWPEPDVFLPERWLDSPAAPGADANIVVSSSATAGKTRASGPGQEVESSGDDASAAAAVHTSSADDLAQLGITRMDSKTNQARAFFPFSMGARDCVGQSLAMTQMRVALMMLLGRFRFQLAPESGGKQAVLDSAKVMITMKPAKGLWMNVISRNKPQGSE